MKLSSWGNYKFCQPKAVLQPHWLVDTINFDRDTSFLCYGMGRSYGDVCLDDNGSIINTQLLNRLQSFDADAGIVTVEAGITIKDLLDFLIPKGWILPVMPGTQYVTIGGAIANDVHGKNHHKAGTFGCHVLSFDLLRSDGHISTCSKDENTELYTATIGGLGLTGMILSATVQLKAISSSNLQVQTQVYRSLDEFIDLSESAEQTFDYTAAWLDTQSYRKGALRGILLNANFSEADNQLEILSKKSKTVPCFFPNFALNKLSTKLFNQFYYYTQRKKPELQFQHYQQFFFPLDGILHWNRIYGRRGFLQYQFVIPRHELTTMNKMFQLISDSGMGSFLSVLKLFGDIQSPGLLSFPQPGLTLALDFPNQGERTLKFLAQLDQLLAASGGRLYPAKDARMCAEFFQQSYPNLERFNHSRDGKFQSDFARRVMGV